MNKLRFLFLGAALVGAFSVIAQNTTPKKTPVVKLGNLTGGTVTKEQVLAHPSLMVLDLASVITHFKMYISTEGGKKTETFESQGPLFTNEQINKIKAMHDGRIVIDEIFIKDAGVSKPADPMVFTIKE